MRKFTNWLDSRNNVFRLMEQEDTTPINIDLNKLQQIKTARGDFYIIPKPNAKISSDGEVINPSTQNAFFVPVGPNAERAIRGIKSQQQKLIVASSAQERLRNFTKYLNKINTTMPNDSDVKEDLANWSVVYNDFINKKQDTISPFTGKPESIDNIRKFLVSSQARKYNAGPDYSNWAKKYLPFLPTINEIAEGKFPDSLSATGKLSLKNIFSDPQSPQYKQNTISFLERFLKIYEGGLKPQGVELKDLPWTNSMKILAGLKPTENEEEINQAVKFAEYFSKNPNFINWDQAQKNESGITMQDIEWLKTKKGMGASTDTGGVKGTTGQPMPAAGKQTGNEEKLKQLKNQIKSKTDELEKNPDNVNLGVELEELLKQYQGLGGK